MLNWARYCMTDCDQAQLMSCEVETRKNNMFFDGTQFDYMKDNISTEKKIWKSIK